MKTIVIAAQKGGAGKTTLARNLSVAAVQDGRTVLCLDLDPQGSLRAWWESCEADMPAMLEQDPAPQVLSVTLDAAQVRFDLCVIDTPPAASEWLAQILRAADLALIPVRPSPDDLRAVGATIAAVNGAKAPFAFVLSQTPVPGSRKRPPVSWRSMGGSLGSTSHSASATPRPAPRDRASWRPPTPRRARRSSRSGVT